MGGCASGQNPPGEYKPGDPAYTICVVSADKPKGAWKGRVHVKLIGDGGKVGEEEQLPEAEFPEECKRGQKHTFNLAETKINHVDGIEIRGDKSVGDGWNIDRVIVTHKKTGKETVFAVFTNIKSNRTYKFMSDDTQLPHLSAREEDRQRDLVEARELYVLTEARLPGCPPLVKDLPSEEDFSFNYKLDIGGKLAALEVTSMVKEAFSGAFKDFDDIKTVYGPIFPEPSNTKRWRDDVLFGMQRLMGLNPAMICLCTKIPEKLAVDDQMLEPFLEKMTLTQAIEKKKIFIVDFEIMDDVPTKTGYVVGAPIALFYQRNDGKLVPIAIQLFQKPGANNPVFLPSDPEYVWILAKMWVNQADSNYHQSVAHLGFTHLKMEGIAACTHRQMHKSHPLFKLLKPHFIYLFAINYLGVPLLLGEDGFVPKTLSVGRKGMIELIKRKQKTWRMDVEGTLPNDLKERGVDDSTLLPHYYYRNDAKELYDAIFRYVKKYLDLYYASDDNVQKDYELQKWRQELVAPIKDKGLGILGVFGENDKFTNKEQVCLTLTSIIFTCSGQHAAVNFRQYEEFSYPPNYPSTLRGSPPTNKDEITEDDLAKSLAEKTTTYDVLVLTSVLSTNDMNSLGDFEVQYITDEKALKVVKEFRADLARIAKGNKEKNKKGRMENYWCMSPDRVPNAISI